MACQDCRVKNAEIRSYRGIIEEKDDLIKQLFKSLKFFVKELEQEKK